MNQKNSQNFTQTLKARLKEGMPDAKGHLIFWPVVILGVIADLWSKSAVFEWLSKKPGNYHVVIDGILNIIMAENRGAAFSMAYGRRAFLITISATALIAVLVYFLFGKIKSRLMQFALALFTAGIIGNLYDRLFNEGKVRDFIDVVYWPGKHWPTFNIADSMLCIAVGLLIISNFTSAFSQKPAPPQKLER